MRIRKANLRLELRCWGCRAGPWSQCFSRCFLSPPSPAAPPSPAPPQDNAVVENNQQLVLVGGDGAAGSAAEDVQASLENALVGQQPEQYWLMVVKAEQGIVNAEQGIFNAEQTLANGVLPAAISSSSSSSSTVINGRVGRKRGRRAVPAAGSRCTRNNGKKWRCENPTEGKYFLCQHHHKQAKAAAARRKAKVAAARRKPKAAAALAAVPAAEPAVPLAAVPADEPVGPLAMVVAEEPAAVPLAVVPPAPEAEV